MNLQFTNKGVTIQKELRPPSSYRSTHHIILSALKTLSHFIITTTLSVSSRSPLSEGGICNINKAESGLTLNPSTRLQHHAASALLHLIPRAMHEN